MSGVPRSQCIIRYKSTAGIWGSAWGPAPNFVAIIKSAYFENRTGVAQTARIGLAAAGTGDIFSLATIQLPASDSGNWQGWAVLNSSDLVVTYTSAADICVWVSGAVLAGPAQFPPAGLLVGTDAPVAGPLPAIFQ